MVTGEKTLPWREILVSQFAYDVLIEYLFGNRSLNAESTAV